MKILVSIVLVVALGYLFFAYSSKAPGGVERAIVTEDTSTMADTSSNPIATTTGEVTSTNNGVRVPQVIMFRHPLQV